ncbi:uncharacterized protein Z520_06761 [Fonsecaea multimorphosa CBS 102226]|uniref:Uncharacterized protein n=1 Tax=Fonsecaea multimorphosa CBS 102226 TaxID=1442371 RepID=A0A0D2K2K4_9EURO|nr:uncharacterized protein Z520_06761 [Fonsecaea multimorphosa CBS 102226]KIX97309.1 hypothetical protein Z520_06761 [Fonsecaea multimorphosa CBS 102226]OAL23276.1 hypothetical protein AYO22_06326 [Fonsecaea multimorphosa]
MSFGKLPPEVHSMIIGLVADNSSWKEGLPLRSVSRLFDREIQAQYFDFGNIHTSMDEDTDRTTLRMGLQHLYRLLKGQICARQSRTALITHLKAAVKILLSNPTFHITDDLQARYIHTVNGTVRLEPGDRTSQTASMVALGVLEFLAGDKSPLCVPLARLTRSPRQIDSLSWALVTAISMKDIATIKALVEQEPQMAGRKYIFADPLRLAVTSHWYDIVRYLLDNGADVNTPHHYAHCSPRYERMLIELPCLSGDVRMVALLLEPQYGVKLDATDYDRLLWSTVRKYCASTDDTRYVDIIRLFLQTLPPNNQASVQHLVVHLAVVYDVPELIPIVVEMGYDVNETEGGRSHLFLAAARGQNGIVQVLLDHGARHSLQSDLDAVKAACVNGRANVLRTLLTRVTSIGEYGHALAAGHFLLAAKASCSDPETMSRYIKVLDCLYEYGLDLNAANCGIKALRFAIENHQDILATNLLEKGVRLPDTSESNLAQSMTAMSIKQT